MKIIINFLKAHHQKILLAGMLALLIFVLPEMAFAQAAPASPPPDNENIKRVFDMVRLVVEFLQAILWPLLILIGALMNNDLIFGYGMTPVILGIWRVVRDFVNLFMVLVLLAVAIANIVGVSREEYQIRTILPKIAIALIAVNFSFVACKFVLDVVHVTSTAIIALPLNELSGFGGSFVQEQPAEQSTAAAFSNTNERVAFAQEPQNQSSGGSQTATDKHLERIEKEYCPVLEKYLSQKKTESDALSQQAATVGSIDKVKLCEDKKLTPFGRSFFARLNAQNIALVLAVEMKQMFNIEVLNFDGINSLKDLTVQMIITAALYIIYAVTFVALFITLLARLIVLWITIVMSPLIALGFTNIGRLKEATYFDNDEAVGAQFMTHALIPLKISVALAICYILVSALKANRFGNSTMSLGGSEALLPTTVTSVQDLLISLATVGFIWKAVKQSMDKGLGSSIVKKVFDTTETAAKTIASYPLSVPIIPVGEGGKKTSIGTLFEAPKIRFQNLAQDHDKESRSALGLTATPDQTLKELADQKDPNRKKELMGRSHRDFYRTESTMTEEQRKQLVKALPMGEQNIWNPVIQKAGIFRKDMSTKITDLQQLHDALNKGDITEAQIGKLFKEAGKESMQAETAEKKKKKGELAQKVGAVNARALNNVKTALGKQISEIDENKQDAGPQLTAIESKVDNLAKASKLTTSITIADEDLASNGTTLKKAKKQEFQPLIEALQKAGLKVNEIQPVLQQIVESKVNPPAKATDIVKDLMDKGNGTPTAQPTTQPAAPNTPNPPPANP